MAVEDFLTQQASDGTLDSEGAFTLDLSKAADKLAAFALPSHSHYLLKIVQVAHRLLADEIRVTIERFRTVVRFRAPLAGSITDSEAIYNAFVDPLEIQDPLMFDLVSGLMGTITEENLETLWSFSTGHRGRRVFINSQRRFSIKDFQLSRPLDEEQHPNAYTLSVLHPKSWKFWLGAKRRAAAAKVLEDNCQLSGVKIFVDGRQFEIKSAKILNGHLPIKGFWGDGHFEVRTAASNMLFLLANEDEQRFSLLRPSLSAYVVRADYMNLWVSGTRVYNSLKPDGESGVSWMLQFRQDNENISMRMAPKRVPCKAALGVGYEEGKDSPLRIKIVRNGITVLERTLDEYGKRFKQFNGCCLIFCDDELETDLTGLQVIQDEAFLERVESFKYLLPKVREFYEKGSKMLTM